jgi:hypothetical protein
VACVGLPAGADWLGGCRDVPCRRVAVVAFTSIDLIGFLPGGNLDLAELAAPILVFGVVAQAVLLVQFVRDILKCGFEFISRTFLFASKSNSVRLQVKKSESSFSRDLMKMRFSVSLLLVGSLVLSIGACKKSPPTTAMALARPHGAYCLSNL